MRSRYGRYEVVRPLGAGAYGEVFLARDPELARDVAVKAVRGERVGRDGLDLLLREARAAAALHHPGLVTIFDVGSEADLIWVVMEYVPGETLRRRLDRGPLTLGDTVRLGAALCGALAVAHGQGVVHRDIKPANILMTPEGEPKLADFGMARAPGEHTIGGAGVMLGTIMYLSPQQAMGEPVDARADLFSLAAVLYEALTGVSPFLRGGEAATLYAILHESPGPPRPDGPQLDPRTQAFFARALHKDPEERHPDAMAFAEDLLALLEPAAAGDLPAARSAPRGVSARFEARLVGRDAELRRVLARLERVRAGEGGALLLAGEAGIGKTRLLAELTGAAEQQRIRVLRGRALLEGGPAYHPWSQVLTQAFDGAAPGSADGLVRFVAGHPGFAGSREASLRRLLHLGGADAGEVIGPDQLWEAAVSSLLALAGPRPLLVVLDDLHWADRNSLQLFRYAAAHARGQKWLLIGAFRPEEAEGESAAVTVGEITRLMGREEGVETVHLARLDEAATAAMVADLLPEAADVPIDRRIFSETEGNPLFILEVAKLVADQGGRLDDFAVPARVKDVVEHRLDRLTAQERDGLEVAAVEGEYFHVGPLATALELTRIKALKLLQGLERRHRIVRPAEQRFRFDHGKIREVILARIAPELRREYHRIVAECLLEEPAHVSSALLAHHFSEAGDPLAALPHRRAAAAAAREVFANQEALHHLGLALATLEAHPDAVSEPHASDEVRLAMAEVHQLIGDYAIATGLLRAVSGAVDGAPALRARALFGEGECEFALARYDQAFATLAAAAAAAAQSAGEQALLCRIHVATARVHTRRGEFDEALAACARAESAGDAFHRELARLESGDICLKRGALAGARAHFDAVLEIAATNGHLVGQARALSGLATVARESGDFPGALAYLDRAAAIYRRMGDPQGEARTFANQGNVHLNRGEWAEARDRYERALQRFRALGDRHGESVALNNMCVALSAGGDYEAATRTAELCLTLMRELGERWSIGAVLDNIGVLQLRRGRVTDARRRLQEAVRMRRELGDRAGLADSLLSLALVERALGARDAAAACAREALEHVDAAAEIAAAARGLIALCEPRDDARRRGAADELVAIARRTAERGDAELAAARALPAGELLASIGDWPGLAALVQDEVERCARIHMLYEEAWARLLLARAHAGAGRAADAVREVEESLRSCQAADLRGMGWRGAAWLADQLGDREPQRWGTAADALERYLDTMAPDDRRSFLERSGAGGRLAAWAERARRAGAGAAGERLDAVAREGSLR